VLTQAKALADTDTIASTPREATWDKNIIPPPQPVTEPQSVSMGHSSRRVILTWTPLQDSLLCDSAVAASLSQIKLAGLFKADQFACPALSNAVDDARVVGPNAVDDARVVGPSAADFNFAGTVSTTS